jgi:hypothetical protein
MEYSSLTTTKQAHTNITELARRVETGTTPLMAAKELSKAKARKAEEEMNTIKICLQWEHL